MDEQARRWLIAEVDRLNKVERRHSRRRMVVLVALVGVAILGGKLLALGLGRMMSFLLPYGIG